MAGPSWSSGRLLLVKIMRHAAKNELCLHTFRRMKVIHLLEKQKRKNKRWHRSENQVLAAESAANVKPSRCHRLEHERKSYEWKSMAAVTLFFCKCNDDGGKFCRATRYIRARRCHLINRTFFSALLPAFHFFVSHAVHFLPQLGALLVGPTRDLQ